MQTSVEGNSLRKNNSSYLSWKAPFRPAIIVNRILNKGGRLTNLTPEGALSLKEFGVDYLPDSLSNLSAYVFPHAIEVYSP
jgi:hypothetical protein